MRSLAEWTNIAFEIHQSRHKRCIVQLKWATLYTTVISRFIHFSCAMPSGGAHGRVVRCDLRSDTAAQDAMSNDANPLTRVPWSNGPNATMVSSWFCNYSPRALAHLTLRPNISRLRSDRIRFQNATLIVVVSESSRRPSAPKRALGDVGLSERSDLL
ncbi:hypothetical protein DFH94DRAFT_474783 [Russula ochroleuca]|uniref:Uncharacterized protein n=1 Tax=Russula ochroleuca TaxID=152965 RepID=A0A9P5MWP1_9AGAM|nr:hypothetical protein DFH94DRAFT_474783 [Russula ochroleuca]